MPDSPWTGVKKAVDVCGRFEPRGGMPAPGEALVRDFFDRLCREDRSDDAVVFLAHLLPIRETVWWGCLCVWQGARSKPSAESVAALDALVGWVREPTDAKREAVARFAGSDEPVQFLAQAVGYSGPSLTPPGLPVVPPPPFLANRIAAGAVRLAAARGGSFRDFLQWGTDVADGKNRWS